MFHTAGIGLPYFHAFFCCSNIDLDPMSFIHKLDLYSRRMYQMTKNELSTSRLFEVIVLHSHTCRQMPPIKLQCRFAGGNNVKVK